MKLINVSRLIIVLIAGISVTIATSGLASCSKKTGSSKSTSTSNDPGSVDNPTSSTPPPAEEKDGMQIKRDANGNFVIHLVVVNLEAVKLMKPVKEGYVVWMTNESNVTSNIGTIEGAGDWTAKKDKVKFEATSPVKPAKVFITAETNLKADKPGKQIVWSTGSF